MTRDETEPHSGKVATIFHNTLTAWIVLAISLLLTLAGWLVASAHSDQRARDRFDFEVDTAVQSIAKRMIDYGADALILEGSEAGGHIGHVSTVVLLQEIRLANLPEPLRE